MNILLVEDDVNIASNIGQYLEAKNHRIDYAYNGKLGLKLALETHFNLIILDLTLPGLDGIDVCRQFRQQAKFNTPILMLTARDTLEDKLTGFEVGADDYLVKPFSLLELDARMTALNNRNSSTHQKNSNLVIDDLVLDCKSLDVKRAEQSIKLKPMAFKLLELLMLHHDRVVPKKEIIESLWPDDMPDGDPLRVHIHSLRTLIDKPFNNPLIHTIHGVGYRVCDLSND